MRHSRPRLRVRHSRRRLLTRPGMQRQPPSKQLPLGHSRVRLGLLGHSKQRPPRPSLRLALCNRQPLKAWPSRPLPLGM